MECYICMEEGQLIKLPCACKNLPVHPECLKEWLKNSDILTCGVCKTDFNPYFMKDFVPIDDLWNYPNKGLHHYGLYYKTYIVMPGLKDVYVVNDEFIFNNGRHKTQFFEAIKRKDLSERLMRQKQFKPISNY